MRGRNLNDLTGLRFGRLTVVGREKNYERITKYADGTFYKNVHARWRCRCDCGYEVIVLSGNLVSGRTKSCGCLFNEYRLRGKRYEQKTL